ncbi:YceI family protein [Psychroserpens sp.]|uniref:YceI family protein n=1 Tax=Psychroserpens sp. TaxID=2020870 RepID=UPI003858BDCA
MKKIKIICVFLSFLLTPVVYAQDLNSQISVDFKIRNLGLNVNGFFEKATITSNFNDEDIAQWSLSGSVDVNSITTGNKKRDKHLLKDDYFDVETYPEIVIEATNFKKTSSKANYEVTVNLTIKKTTKTIKIPMLIANDKRSLTLKTYFEINRRNFGVGGSSFILSDTVKININYTLIKE